jgi:hypothetical protein
MILTTKFFWTVTLMTSVVFTTSCHSQSEDPMQCYPPHDPRKLALALKVDSILEEARICKEDPDCYAEKYFQTATWSQEDYDWFKEGPRVLIIDTEIPLRLILGRYKKRFINVFKTDDSGHYHSIPQIEVEKIPRDFLRITEWTGHFKDYYSAQNLHETRSDAIHTFFTYKNGKNETVDEMQSLTLGHGGAAISIIGEYVPSASLMFAQAPFPPKVVLCKKDFKTLESFASQAGASLVEKIREENINLINIAGGDAVHDLKVMFEHICDENLSDQEAYSLVFAMRPYYRHLDESGALMVQSAPNGLSKNRAENEWNYPIDCASSYNNRICVSYQRKGAYMIPQRGIAVSSNERNPCVDIYVNFNSDRNDSEGLYWSDGFFFEKITVPFTSWMSPVVTAFIASRHSDWGSLHPAQIKERIFKGRDQIVLDPITHKQFEAFRWGVIK